MYMIYLRKEETKMNIKELTLEWLHEQWVSESNYSKEHEKVSDSLRVIEHLLNLVEEED